ncbi:MAG TPA: 4-hydroxy-tetrahydrodipicolinate synthase [Acidobacteriota bacterium]|nr:4-hydroxy-tetrahydrodipicolinate synthase [Acidobacteriota bacterium]
MPRMKLKGMFVPHITPFSHNGELDLTALRTCVRFWLKGGVSGLVPCGSNGEAPYLSREERIKVIQTVTDEVNGKIPVIAGTGSMSTKETILFTKDAKDLGADAVLIVTPFYYKPSNKETHEHYKAVLDAVDIPIVLYSVPKFTGFPLEPVTIAQLASEYENIIGIKDSGGNLGTITETIRTAGDKISVLAGTADLALSTLMLGGSGAVVAVANAFPRMCTDLYESFLKSDYKKAGDLQRSISYMNEVLVKRHNQLSAIKEALNKIGLPAGYPRRPALPLDNKEKKEIENLITHFVKP